MVHVTISVQTERVLAEIAKKGIYGRSAAEVAARFIDQALEKFTGVPKIAIPTIRRASRK